MKTILKSIIWVLFFGLLSCEEDSNETSYLSSIDSDKYYSNEIIPLDYQQIYGKWRLYEVSGGISGTGYEPDYDYLEIKKFGIYGLIRDGRLFEYGKIELDTFDINTEAYLQVKLIPDYYVGRNPNMDTPEKYVDLKGTDSLNLISPCCDLYNYHYKRVK